MSEDIKPITAEELRDAGFAPGNYCCKCVPCGAYFDGDKRASRCQNCATKTVLERRRLSALLKLGDKVKVSPTYVYAVDWREIYFITAIKARVGSGEPAYAIGDHWPPRHLGDFTDGWHEHDLVPAGESAR